MDVCGSWCVHGPGGVWVCVAACTCACVTPLSARASVWFTFAGCGADFFLTQFFGGDTLDLNLDPGPPLLGLAWMSWSLLAAWRFSMAEASFGEVEPSLLDPDLGVEGGSMEPDAPFPGPTLSLASCFATAARNGGSSALSFWTYVCGSVSASVWV